jgi:hypothetical protein
MPAFAGMTRGVQRASVDQFGAWYELVQSGADVPMALHPPLPTAARISHFAGAPLKCVAPSATTWRS